MDIIGSSSQATALARTAALSVKPGQMCGDLLGDRIEQCCVGDVVDRGSPWRSLLERHPQMLKHHRHVPGDLARPRAFHSLSQGYLNGDGLSDGRTSVQEATVKLLPVGRGPNELKRIALLVGAISGSLLGWANGGVCHASKYHPSSSRTTAAGNFRQVSGTLAKWRRSGRMGCWGATRECFRSCGRGPHSEHYDAWLARERLRQLNVMTERCDQLQRSLAQMELVTTQTQDILASYRDLDQMEATQTEMTRQASIAQPPQASRSLARVTFTQPDAAPMSRRSSQASAEDAAQLRARIQSGARQMQQQPRRQARPAIMQNAFSADLDAIEAGDDGIAPDRVKPRQAPPPQQRPTDSATRERQATMDRLRQPMPAIPARDFKFSTPPPIGDTPKVQRAPTPFAAKGAGAAAFASTHGYAAPQPASDAAKP